MRYLLLCWICLLSACTAMGQLTRQDTLRGSNGRGRDWWDVLKYDLRISLDTVSREIRGECTITFRVTLPPRDSMQIDLQDSLELDRYPSIRRLAGDSLMEDMLISSREQEGQVWWLVFGKEKLKQDQVYQLTLSYSGKPAIATDPPWQGGLIWAKDANNKPWIAVACQGAGASIWWPCKDYQADKPDSGTSLSIRQMDSLYLISNGILANRWEHVTTDQHTGSQSSIKGLKWQVRNPINTYNTSFYIGDYTAWGDTFQGVSGTLQLSFFPLRYNEARARQHWAVTKDMLRCFEHWMGPYPFYADGYKLVEAPYLGMEHQSAIAYGNKYQMGYLGTDRSNTGVGMAFDYIIIHESGHEWFGNSITAADVADNWIHEGFTTYTETLFAEWVRGREAAFIYTTGKYELIQNDQPVIGSYGVRREGSGDKYEKGAAIVHMIRLMINDDEKFRQLLRGLNRDFYHKTVTSRDVEDYISRFCGINLKVFFDVYLRSTQKPVVEWDINAEGNISFRWKNMPDGFVAPCSVRFGNRTYVVNAGTRLNHFSFPGARRSELIPFPEGWSGWYDITKRR